MLIDQINDFKSGMIYPDGYVHDRALDPFRTRLLAAQAFVLDREASAMAASVSMSKPSSIVSALQWVRLPFAWTWVEFANADLREAMAMMGSPNIAPEGGIVNIERSGFLLTMQGEDIIFDYAHAVMTKQNEKAVDLSPVRGRFSLRGDITTPPDLNYPLELHPDTSGRVRKHNTLIAESPEELAADIELRTRFSWASHPDMARVHRNVTAMMGARQVAQIEERQSEEMYRLFALQVLPALILLNCRNAVDTEMVAASPKLNKARAAKGKAPLVDHRIVKMHLTPAAKRRISVGEGTGSRASRGTLVTGHFKVRKGGIFWWNPHARRGYGEASPKTIILTR